MSSYGFLYTSSRVLVWSDSAGYCMKFIRPFWLTYADFAQDVLTSWPDKKKYEVVKDTIILTIGICLSPDYFSSRCGNLQDCLNEMVKAQEGSPIIYPMYLFYRSEDGIIAYFLDAITHNKIERMESPSYMVISGSPEPEVMVKDFLEVDELFLEVNGKLVKFPIAYWHERMDKLWNYGNEIFSEITKKYPLFMSPWNLCLMTKNGIEEKTFQ